MATSEEKQRREVHFQGMVQGVGFRYTTCRIASRFAVAGYVQNLPDGRVRLVAEGWPSELDRFLDAVQAPMARFIDGVEVTVQPATGEYRRFEIRY